MFLLVPQLSGMTLLRNSTWKSTLQLWKILAPTRNLALQLVSHIIMHVMRVLENLIDTLLVKKCVTVVEPEESLLHLEHDKSCWELRRLL
jgi:hypothetical protein